MAKVSHLPVELSAVVGKLCERHTIVVHLPALVQSEIVLGTAVTTTTASQKTAISIIICVDPRALVVPHALQLGAFDGGAKKGGAAGLQEILQNLRPKKRE